MKRNKGFTLLEVQISALIMVIVLIASGVIFYFALSSIRYLHDAFAVYTNATTAMKVITNEVMVSNCYGSNNGGPGYVPDVDSFYGAAGYIQVGPAVSGQNAHDSFVQMPSLGGVNDRVVTAIGGTGLFLRQVTPPSDIRSDRSDSPGDFPWHEEVRIYRQNIGGRPKLVIERFDPNSPGGASTVIAPLVLADNVTMFDFEPIAYNMVHVFLTVEGDVIDPDPAAGGAALHSLTLSKAITLRCAPSVTPIPDGVSW